MKKILYAIKTIFLVAWVLIFILVLFGPFIYLPIYHVREHYLNNTVKSGTTILLEESKMTNSKTKYYHELEGLDSNGDERTVRRRITKKEYDKLRKSQ